MLHKYDNIYGAFVNDIMNPTHKTIRWKSIPQSRWK